LDPTREPAMGPNAIAAVYAIFFSNIVKYENCAFLEPGAFASASVASWEDHKRRPQETT
jgi:hypothetical protein